MGTQTRWRAILAPITAITSFNLLQSITLAQTAQPEHAVISKPVKKTHKSSPVVFGSVRVRPEAWQWFQPRVPGTSTNKYTFTGSILRLGVTGAMPGGSYTVEAADTLLLGLPKHASAPSPLGTFGAGGNYYAGSGTKTNSLFIKQAVANFVGSDQHDILSLGRFEFNEGMETKPLDPSLGWLQQNRITQRLIGTFGWTDVGRSFDGGKFVRSQPNLNITGVIATPTQGAFTLNGDNSDIGDVRVDYLGLTLPQTDKNVPALARLFSIYYQDARTIDVKTDNRSLTVREHDLAPIRITTLGGDYARVLPAPEGKIDVLAWGADQFGQWGLQNDSAYAYDIEAGYQPKAGSWKPWYRIGDYYASGDSTPGDSEHNTFFPILPTTRIYARFPFYSETNIDDTFAEIILRPNVKTSVRADYHNLRLASSKDLWYQGGGAFQASGNFGYAGTTSSGKSGLATLLDVSVDYKQGPKTTLSLYYGYALPGDVVKALYTNSAATLGYVEATQAF